MAVENMFIASAITTFGMLGFFTYMYHQADSWLWRRVWLFGSLSTLYLSLGILRKGFQNVVVINDLADLTFAAMTVLMWCIVLMIGWLFLSLLYHGIRRMIHIAEGRRPEQDEIEARARE